ncbi:reverse transcriptase domain-containing protein [Actinosynnema sp. NPDC059797]
MISVPTARDRIALRALTNFLVQVFPDARGVIPQVRVEEVHKVLRSGRFNAFVRLDVKDFYPSISHDQVLKELRKRIRKDEILKVLLAAIRTPTVPDRAMRRKAEKRGVPQGLAISNVLAELVVSPIDAEMKSDDRCVYTRFVDDVLILCDRADAESLGKKASNLFRAQGLKVHRISTNSKKSYIGMIEDGFDYLGYTFKGDRVSVRPSSVHKVESALARIFTQYKKSLGEDSQGEALAKCTWYTNLRITGCIYKGVARGWLHYFRQMNDRTLLKELDATVRRFERRFEMPARFRPKSFMRAYWAIHHPNGRHYGYVPNFDKMPVSEMRTALIQILGFSKVHNLSDAEVARTFDALASKAVMDLERDIGSVS